MISLILAILIIPAWITALWIGGKIGENLTAMLQRNTKAHNGKRNNPEGRG